MPARIVRHPVLPLNNSQSLARSCHSMKVGTLKSQADTGTTEEPSAELVQNRCRASVEYELGEHR